MILAPTDGLPDSAPRGERAGFRRVTTMHWAPTSTGYTLTGFTGRADLVRTVAGRRVTWTLHTDATAHVLGRRATFTAAERLLGLA